MAEFYAPAQPVSNRLIAPAAIVKKRRVGKIILTISLALTLLCLCFVSVSLIGLETGVSALTIGMLIALLPVPFYAFLILWIDRYESEPLWLLGLCFLWGASGAVLISLIFNTLNGLAVGSLLGNEAGEFFSLTISAPIVEESAKGAFLLLLYFWQKNEFDGVIDGIVYAGMIALGFATVENFQYYAKASLEHQTLVVFVLRGMLAPLSHPLFTAMTGAGFGLARQSRNRRTKWIFPVLGYGTAILLHFIWNFSAGMGLFLLVYIFGMVPLFILSWILVVFAIRREGALIRNSLTIYAENGLFNAQELDNFCSLRSRMKYSWKALHGGGFNAWRQSRRLHLLISELAFHRNRVQKGDVSLNDETLAAEHEYLQEIVRLYQQNRHYRV